MHYFRYKKGVLHAEDVSITELVERYGSPLYIYSASTIERHFLAYQRAFKGIPHIVCYALKANSNAGILKLLASLGSGADIVSGGELFRALKAGIHPKKIVYAGVGKRDDEIEYALKKGILMFNIESEEEMMRIDEIAGRLGKKAPVALRINPDIDPGTHPYISTGLKKHKFGLPIENALEYYRKASSLPNTRVVGIHKHIGSQITRVEPFADALERILLLVDRLREEGMAIQYLDMGGGLGIRYSDEDAPYPSELAKKVKPLIKNKNITLVLEPGRSIIGNAGIFVTQVLYRKPGDGKEFVVVDGGMNDLMRPSLYNAYHEIIPVKKTRRKEVFADIVGPICESGDFLGKERNIPRPAQGELLAVLSAGAYGFSMSSNYNSRPRPAEVLVKGGEHYLIRERETLKDLVRGEKIPGFLR
ncbi:MAG: diaminopimelate decarboxylase [Nitrospirae bacterium]|nr:MAG: diaminopimelate decarboxylase [Nitrospirota bacterium]